MYNVIFYQDGRGRSPVKEWLDDLEQQAKSDKHARKLFKKVVYYIEILSQLGTRSGHPYTKFISDGIWELRPRDYRILLFMWDGNNIVLLHTFRKTTRATPRSEIDRAKKEMSDWQENGHKRL